MEHPPIPESLKGTEKKKSDIIFAAGGNGKVYAIPAEVAGQYVFDGDHPAVEGHSEPAEAHGDEVQGHHRVLLQDGTYGYHSDWLIGWYTWRIDGCDYYGPHWHPYGKYNPLAADEDG